MIKPRIKKIREHHWECRSDVFVGYGFHPLHAYYNWAALYGQWRAKHEI